MNIPTIPDKNMTNTFDLSWLYEHLDKVNSSQIVKQRKVITMKEDKVHEIDPN